MVTRSEEFAAELAKHTGVDFKPVSESAASLGPGAHAKLETGHSVYVQPEIDVPGAHKLTAFDDWHFTQNNGENGAPQVYARVVKSDRVAGRATEILRSKEFMGSIQQSMKDRATKDPWGVLGSDYAKTRFDPDVTPPERD